MRQALPQPTTASKAKLSTQRHQTTLHHKARCRASAVFSGRCSWKWGLVCLHHLSWPWPPRCLQLCIDNAVGWFPRSMPQEQPRAPRQSNRRHPLLRLAMAERLPCHHSQLPSRMFWMQQANSRGSELPSSTKGLMQHHPTTLRLGEDISIQQVYRTGTQAYPTTFDLASTQVSLPLPTPLPHQINCQSLNTALSSIKSYRLNFRRVVTWVPSPKRRLNSCLVLSRLHHSASYPSLDRQESTG